MDEKNGKIDEKVENLGSLGYEFIRLKVFIITVHRVG